MFVHSFFRTRNAMWHPILTSLRHEGSTMVGLNPRASQRDPITTPAQPLGYVALISEPTLQLLLSLLTIQTSR